MSSFRKVRRVVALVACGGTLLQVAGCAAAFAPVVLSYLESSIVNLLLQTLTPP